MHSSVLVFSTDSEDGFYYDNIELLEQLLGRGVDYVNEEDIKENDYSDLTKCFNNSGIFSDFVLTFSQQEVNALYESEVKAVRNELEIALSLEDPLEAIFTLKGLGGDDYSCQFAVDDSGVLNRREFIRYLKKYCNEGSQLKLKLIQSFDYHF